MTLWVVKIGTSLLRGETATTIDGYARCFAGAMDRGDPVSYTHLTLPTICSV